MSNAVKIILILIALLAVIAAVYKCFTVIKNRQNSTAVFSVDASTLGKKLWNPVSNINIWELNDQWVKAEVNVENNIFDFVDYVQFMQMSGGTASRDLFVNPTDTTVLDDYDFSLLIENCRSVVRLGGKPHLKLGSVPLKFTSGASASSEFGTNVYPPDDYNVYYKYIVAIAQALADEFGLEEVQSWHFGVMTEFNNGSWFRAKDNSAESSATAFMKLYDYTTAALQSVLGRDIYIGAHALGQSNGKWDVELFIRHCAQEQNFCTGETGSRLCYLSASHYDVRPGLFAPLSRNLPDTVGYLRQKAVKYGLKLDYGIDEGRLLMGNHRGDASNSLVSRVVGDTYQAAFDARIVRQMFDNDILYFSAWSYLSGGLFKGAPSVSFHVAKHAADFNGSHQISAVKNAHSGPAEVEVVAAYDEESQMVRVMVYHFRNDMDYIGTASVTLNLTIPQLTGKDVTVTRYMVDDSVNYFDEWRKDRKTYGIGDDDFGWSPDDPNISESLRNPDVKKRYEQELLPKYIKAAQLLPQSENMKMNGSELTLEFTLQPQAVLFLEIKPAENTL